MATIKAYTDLEQSKKLTEILPFESADMRYYEYTSHIDGTPKVGYKGGVTEGIPCWSLAALLDVLPTGKVLLHDKGNRGYKCICNNIDSYYFNNPIDACVDMIEKLQELKRS